jgi:hypothetical protein
VTTYTIDTAVSACDQEPGELSVEQAHAIMQQHQHFTGNCKHRTAALALLVATGRYVLARHLTRPSPPSPIP